MTTLILFKPNASKNEKQVKNLIDWGTGKARTPTNRPKSPRLSGTFLHTGEPITQTYENTDLTLSNVRINDELVPAPLHTTDMTSHQIPLEFPSNHPYTSHICENAMFPTGTTDLNDRPSTCADPYIVTHKIRGNPFRREVHYHGFQRERCRSLKWPDKNYMQLPRSISDVSSSSSPIYPWPRKMFAPNSTESKQRTLTEITQENNYSNPQLINDSTFYSSDEQLKAQSTRLMENMQTAQTHDIHRQSNVLEREKPSTYYAPMETTKLMSQTEKLDEQLLNGTDYVNLPAHLYPTEKAPTWIPQLETSNNNNNDPMKHREIRFLHHLRPSTTGSQISRDHYKSHQQMDAENRLQQLEVIRPKENIDLLNVKFRTVQHPRHARPILPQYRDDYVNTLYDQVGTYVQERAGLYHTENYNPNELVQAIPELENQNEICPTQYEENNLNHLLNQGEQIQNRTKPKLLQDQAIGDYQYMRNHLLNKLRVPRDSGTVNSRVQEGNKQFVQRQSVYGQAYNTPKFLQENVLSFHARVDPTRLMSTTYNTNLERVRSFNSYPIKQTDENPTIKTDQVQINENLCSPVIRPLEHDEIYVTKHINEHTNGFRRRETTRVYDSPFYRKQQIDINQLYQPQTTSFESNLSNSTQIPRSVKTKIQLTGPEIVARSIEPKIDPPTTYQRSYKDISYHETLPQTHITTTDNKHIDNLNKQTKLMQIQEQWSKTQAQQQYHEEFPEAVPYVGYCTIRAKKEILIADQNSKHGMMTAR